MPVRFSDHISAEDCRAEPHALFLFGDNDVRVGKGGQAQIRHMPNAHGIRTKHLPSTITPAYFSDDNLIENCEKIDEDFRLVFAELLVVGRMIVVPRNIGCGLAKLDIKAPATFAYLRSRIDSLMRLSIDWSGNR